MIITQEKDCPMVIRAASEMQKSGAVMDLKVAVRFQRSCATRADDGCGAAGDGVGEDSVDELLQAAIASASIRTIAIGRRLVIAVPP
ncbi:MAG: hypothetical protein ABJA98_33230 [Acidobacteriota bacterium]